MSNKDNTNLLLCGFNHYNDFSALETCINLETQQRLDGIVSHMYKQYKQYLTSSLNTSLVFESLLVEMLDICNYIKGSFEQKGMLQNKIFCEIDADRSIAILNILWNSISFTTRGNTKPQALERKGNKPLFAGRIIALHGDFQDAALELQDQEYPDILKCEIASLYVSYDQNLPVIMKLKHVPDKEYMFNYQEAARNFLLKVIEIICGGGIFHEVAPFYNEEH